MDFFKRTWVEIDIKALENNYNVICKNSKSKVIPVVKADAYGHGADYIVPALQNQGADFFAVSNVAEAVELRELGINGDILILGYTPVDSVSVLIKYNIIQCVYSLDYAKLISQKAIELNGKIKSHLKLDTGMGRIGFGCRQEKLSEILEALSLDGLCFDGVFTHFAVADSGNKNDIDYTNNQYKIFDETVKKLENSGYSFNLKHCCNSAGIISCGGMHMDAVRAGIILYGLNPSDDVDMSSLLVPVMSMYSVVSMVKELDMGDCVSYGRTYSASKKCRIATVSAGYADGVPRLLSNNGYVIIKGKKAPIVGRVCMDQFCIDVSDIQDVAIGDTVEIFGKNLSVDEVAKSAQTINYEIVCGISKRVSRVLI